MASLYPLKFKPRLVEKIWGGRKLETHLGKSLPPLKNIGESWELFDFPPGVVDHSSDWVSAAVTNGPLAGRTLHQLMIDHRQELLGDIPPVGEYAQFPILIKFLDAREDLSLQVHPPQTYADQHPGAHLKTEAWYVLQHDPGARLLKGLKPNVSAGAFKSAIQTQAAESLVTSIAAKVGDCHFLPSGTVHALGAGMLVAEVQTPSDTTFRVYDFGRLENGKPRKLHVAEALECIDFTDSSDGQSSNLPATQATDSTTTVRRHVNCQFFVIDHLELAANTEKVVPTGRPIVWIMLSGKVVLSTQNGSDPVTVKAGETVLLPAGLDATRVRSSERSQWLRVMFQQKNETQEPSW